MRITKISKIILSTHANKKLGVGVNAPIITKQVRGVNHTNQRKMHGMYTIYRKTRNNTGTGWYPKYYWYRSTELQPNYVTNPIIEILSKTFFFYHVYPVSLHVIGDKFI